MPFIAIALVLAAAVGGGASVAAQNALPGDALWGFKVAVNENVGAAFAVSDKAQADWDISRVSARLAEAQKLAAEGRFSAGAQASVESNFNAHAESVAEHVARLQAKGDYAAAADVAARFQAAVAQNASALAEARVNAQGNGKEALGVIIGKVQATLDIASNLSAEASSQASAQAQAESEASASANANANANSNGSVNAGQDGVQVDTTTGVQVGI